MSSNAEQHPPAQDPPKQETNVVAEAIDEITTNIGLSIWTYLLTLGTGLLLGITIVYAWALTETSGPLTKLIPHSLSLSLNVLRVTSEVTGMILAGLCATTLQATAWTFASARNGTAMSSFLGISPSTGIVGLAFLFIWKRCPGGDYHHLWVAKRYICSHVNLLM